jgi:hypothetical protein
MTFAAVRARGSEPDTFEAAVRPLLGRTHIAGECLGRPVPAPARRRSSWAVFAISKDGHNAKCLVILPVVVRVHPSA